MTVTLLIWFPQTILCFTNCKTKRKPCHRSKLDSQSINCFVFQLISDFFSRKKKKKPGIFAENIDDPQRFMDDHKKVFCTPLNKFCQITRKSWLWYYYQVPAFFAQTSLLSQKMLIRFGKKHFDFLEECVMLPKQKMELALKISQNPKKFWIIKPPGWSFICGVKILKVFSAEAPMQILHCVTQSCSYSYFSSIFFSQIYE